MPERDLITLFVVPLNRFEIRYLVSGSVASMLYGEPRVTHDIDLIVFLRSDDLVKISQAYPTPEFYVPPVDVIAIEMARDQRGHFNVIHADTSMKADFYTSNRDEFHAWAFRHARQYTVGEVPVSVAPPEYVIVRKLEFYREGGSEKHLRDIRGMLEMSGNLIDRGALNEWVARFHLQGEWEKASA